MRTRRQRGLPGAGRCSRWSLGRVRSLCGEPPPRVGRRETMSRSSSRGRRLSTVPRSAQHDGKRRSRGCFALFAQIGKRSGRTAKPAARCQLTLEPGPRAGAKNGPGLPSDGRTVRRPDARPTAAAHRVPSSPHWHGRSGGARLQKGRAPPNTAPRRAPLPSKAPHAGAPRRAPPARAARQADAGRDLRPPAP